MCFWLSKNCKLLLLHLLLYICPHFIVIIVIIRGVHFNIIIILNLLLHILIQINRFVTMCAHLIIIFNKPFYLQYTYSCIASILMVEAFSSIIDISNYTIDIIHQ